MDLPILWSSHRGRVRRPSLSKSLSKLRPRLESLESRRLLSNVFSVTNTLDDSNPGSLRWAIGQVNADTTDSAASPDQIHFAIPTSDSGYKAATGVWTIAPETNLPTVTQSVVIDGYTQTGAIPNTLLTSDNAVLKIDLDGGGSQTGDGLLISATDSTVEGLAIGGFQHAGIELTGTGGDSVVGNFIGTDPSGLSGDGNGNGILVESPSDTIGGTSVAARNLVAANIGSDIELYRNGSHVTIEGNFVGLFSDGNRRSLASTSFGILMDGGGYDVIGGTLPAERNVIAGQDTGIFDQTENGGTPGSGSLFEGNYLGTNASGTAALHDSLDPGFGIHLTSWYDTIGGPAAGAGNLISGYAEGIDLEGYFEIVQGNLIGTNAAGNQRLGSSGVGINITGRQETIGGTTTGAGNVISGNMIGITAIVGSQLNTFQGNKIGTDTTGMFALGNQSDGIQVSGAIQFAGVIGGTTPGAGNTIAYNGGAGVDVLDTVEFVDIVGNSIHDNSKLGIDLGGEGVTTNTPGGPHFGPNRLQNYPVLQSVSYSPTSTVLDGVLNSTPNSSFTIQFYANPDADPSGYGQGKTYLGQLIGVQTDASGNANFTFNASDNLSGQYFSATATDSFGNTSEFSRDLPFPSADLAVSLIKNTPTASYGGTVTYTFNIANHGPDAAPNAVITDILPVSLKAVSASATQGNFTLANNVFTDVVGNLQSGASFQVTITATASTIGSISNTLVSDASPFDSNPTNNSATATTVVNRARTIASLSASLNPSTVEQSVIFTATLTPAVSANTLLANVLFLVDGVPTALVPLVPSTDGHSDTASFDTSTLTAGSHQVTVSYAGDLNYLQSQASITQIVNPATSTTTLNVSPNPSTAGQPVTLTAAVFGSVVPTGTVTFFDGRSFLGQVVVGPNGLAQFVIARLAPGPHALTARYDGSASLSPSMSNGVVQVVNPIPTMNPAPTVISVARFGVHAQPTTLAIAFSTPLDPSRAQDTANYTLFGPRKQVIHVTSAVLSSDGKTVVLHPHSRLNIHQTYLLEVTGKPPGGLTSTARVYLDGANNGIPGSNYVGKVTIHNLVQASQVMAHEHAATHRASAVDAVLASGHIVHVKMISARARRR